MDDIKAKNIKEIKLPALKPISVAKIQPYTLLILAFITSHCPSPIKKPTESRKDKAPSKNPSLLAEYNMPLCAYRKSANGRLNNVPI